MISPLRSALVAVALAAAAPATAAAQAVPAPGDPVVLRYAVDATAAPFDGRVPTVLRISVPAGTRVDWRALSRTCDLAAVALGDCSADSRMGVGTARLRITDPRTGVARETELVLNVFRGLGPRVVGLGIVNGGLQEVPGAVDLTGGGLTINLLIPKLVDTPWSTLKLLSFTFDLGTSRKAVVRRTVRRGHGRHRRVVVRRRTVRRDLLRLPKTCPAPGVGWAAPLEFIYADGSVARSQTEVPCVPA